jgi:hypothetical protein
MKHSLLFTAAAFLSFAICITAYGSDLKNSNQKVSSFSIKNDMAFISVMGSRPNPGSLKGFQKAVLYNAQGAKVKEITFTKRDSIYSLDRMLQENKNKGPLFIKMYR